jgi:hypothetical protein
MTIHVKKQATLSFISLVMQEPLSYYLVLDFQLPHWIYIAFEGGMTLSQGTYSVSAKVQTLECLCVDLTHSML